MPDISILVINTGSSSLKMGIYADSTEGVSLLFDGEVEGIGQQQAALKLKNAQGQLLHNKALPCPSQQTAMQAMSGVLHAAGAPTPQAIGHRVVHGGPHLTRHQRITPEVLAQLRDATHFAPLHIPAALSLIDQATLLYPGIPQFACFDTAFHATMPETSARFPLPRELYDAGIRRYGFHGLSYESLVRQLGNDLPPRAVFAHLGSGASLAAIHQGQSIDTTMGFTPTGGIPMATRSGDLDPGLLLHLLRTQYPTAEALENLLNHESGLLALGGVSDMRELESRYHSGDAQAKLAIDIFTLAAAKTIAAFATELDGLDLLVFAGGIGEHSSSTRARICARLHFLGLHLDSAANQTNSPILSSNDSSIQVRILPSQEDLQIALHCVQLLSE